MTKTPDMAHAAIAVELAADTDDEQGRSYRDAAPDPLPAHVTVTQPGQAKSVVYSVRLNPDEVAALESIARTHGVPASTLARGYITQGIAADTDDDVAAAIMRLERDVLDVKRHVLPV
jgi:hypothetical protein